MSAALITAAARTMQRDLIISGWHPSERVDMTVKKDFDTACWSYQPPKGHRVYVGTGITQRMKPGLSQAQKEYYIGSYVGHEFSHIWHTDRDMAATHAMLERISCPFDLLNIFEDSRIEELWRNFTKRPFLWSELEVIDPSVGNTPLGAFFMFVQGEGKFPPNIAISNPEQTIEVEKFYQAALAVRDTLALQPILADWLARFGATVPPNIRFLGGESGELATGAMLQLDIGKRLRFDAEDETGDAEEVKITRHIEGGLLSEERTEVDVQIVARLVKKFEELFHEPVRSSYSNENGKRISATRHALGRPCYRHRTVAQTRSKRVGLVVDCSGSMDGPHIVAAQQLIAVLNRLSQQGSVRGTLVLSGVTDGLAMSEAFTWPVEDGVIRRIHAFGSAEGLQSAITTHADALRECEQIYVFTDANITDEPLNLSILRSRGIIVCGLYVGDSGHTLESMRQHFERFFVRATLDGLIDALLNGGIRNRH